MIDWVFSLSTFNCLIFAYVKKRGIADLYAINRLVCKMGERWLQRASNIRSRINLKFYLAQNEWKKALSNVFSEGFPDADPLPTQERRKAHWMTFLTCGCQVVGRLRVEAVRYESLGVLPLLGIEM